MSEPEIQYFSSYNGMYYTQGRLANKIDRDIFQSWSTMRSFDYRIRINPQAPTQWFISTASNISFLNPRIVIRSFYNEIFQGSPNSNVNIFSPTDTLFFLHPGAQFSTPLVSSLFSIFVSTGAATGESLRDTLPLNRQTQNLYQATSNFFISNRNTFERDGFFVDKLRFETMPIADFPTVYYFKERVSTCLRPLPVQGITTTINQINYGEPGSFLKGGNALNFNDGNGFRSAGGGGGGGLLGGESGAFVVNSNRHFVGGGGGGGGSSWLEHFVARTANSENGRNRLPGFANHPLVQSQQIGFGGLDSNAGNNWLLNSTYGLVSTTSAVGNGRGGALILSEFVDPFRITISNGNNVFIPMRIDPLTSEVVVNKLVISSLQNVSITAASPSNVPLDFGNFQHFYITINGMNKETNIFPSSVHANASLQTGNIILDVRQTANFPIRWSSITMPANINQLQAGPQNVGMRFYEYALFNERTHLFPQ